MLMGALKGINGQKGNGAPGETSQFGSTVRQRCGNGAESSSWLYVLEGFDACTKAGRTIDGGIFAPYHAPRPSKSEFELGHASAGCKAEDALQRHCYAAGTVGFA
jgi:hypothetical protein